MSEAIVPRVTALCPKLLDAAQAFIAEEKARGYVVGIESGLRDSLYQHQLYTLGRTTVNPDGKSEEKPLGNIVTRADAWHSLHEFGLAVDVTFKNEQGNFFWPSDGDSRWSQLGEVGKMFGLQWGGDWPIDILDLDHFQMRPKHLTMAQMKDALIKGGQEAVWALI